MKVNVLQIHKLNWIQIIKLISNIDESTFNMIFKLLYCALAR